MTGRLRLVQAPLPLLAAHSLTARGLLRFHSLFLPVRPHPGSICAMKRNTHVIVPAARFRLLAGDDCTSCYQVRFAGSSRLCCRNQALLPAVAWYSAAAMPALVNRAEHAALHERNFPPAFFLTSALQAVQHKDGAAPVLQQVRHLCILPATQQPSGLCR